MPLLDLREIGRIGPEDEHFLAELICEACQDEVKRAVSWSAQRDMSWSGEALMIYELAGLMTEESARAQGCISSAEWLCGILCSGAELERSHLLALMSFVNADVSLEQLASGQYTSGCKRWSDAPLALRRLLDTLDQALVNEETVKLKLPFAEPIKEAKQEDLEAMSLEQLRELVRIDWE